MPQYLSSINITKDEMKDSVYQQRQHRKNKGGRYPIEDRDMVHSLKCTIKLSPFEKDRLIERAETAHLGLSAYMRKAALGARIYQRYNDEERKWMRDVSNWLNNLNQFNRYCNSYGVDTEMLMKFMKELLNLLTRLEK